MLGVGLPVPPEALHGGRVGESEPEVVAVPRERGDTAVGLILVPAETFVKTEGDAVAGRWGGALHGRGKVSHAEQISGLSRALAASNAQRVAGGHKMCQPTFCVEFPVSYLCIP